MNWLLAGVLCIALVEIVSRLPLMGVVADARTASGRAFKTMSAKGISDHWKEKAILAYAGKLFGATLRLVGILLVVIAIVSLFLWLGDMISPGFSGFMFGTLGLLFSLVFATGYALLRRPGKARQAADGDSSAYSGLDRTLHRLALKNASLADMLLDIEVSRAKPDPDALAGAQHVFVTGLARAGTTILMRRLHASSAFRSLTYRDMPFVLAPNLWARVSGRFGKTIEAHERAHGDGIIVDADSPESFDEAFWRVFDGKSYIREDCLVPHAPADDIRERFREYVGVILSGSDNSRYLSKNNNNVLRLPALSRTFPGALILVPFRDPLSHAASLRAQHRRFLASQSSDPFEVEYMGYLGHHEFGRDHRPFRMTETPSVAGTDTDTLDYWLGLWIDIYGAVLIDLPDNARLVCYEALCEDPAVWHDLAERAGIDPEAAADETPFKVRRHEPEEDIDAALRARAEALYQDLRSRSEQAD